MNKQKRNEKETNAIDELTIKSKLFPYILHTHICVFLYILLPYLRLNVKIHQKYIRRSLSPYKIEINDIKIKSILCYKRIIFPKFRKKKVKNHFSPE